MMHTHTKSPCFRSLGLAVLASTLLFGSLQAETSLEARHPGAEAFVQSMVDDHGLDADRVEQWLDQAEYQQSIIDAITRPAESKPWYQYRPIFMTTRRLEDGLTFWDEHQAVLDQVSETYGVPQEIIVAIIGVETSYGRITGSYRVLDALATLAFHYPKRSSFFTRELREFMLLVGEEDLDIDSVKGSYAGAMGYGQFIPSSYRHYAVDFNGDGKRNLWSPEQDAIASVAHYFHKHGWKPGQPVAFPSSRSAGARSIDKPPLKPAYPLVQLQEWGYEIPSELDPQTPATLIPLEQLTGTEYWIGLDNFYVISRYNHSALYSMAVHQLSQQLREAFDAR